MASRTCKSEIVDDKGNIMKTFFKLILITFSFSITNLTLAGEPVSTGFFSKSAIGQHDTTAYHLDKKAQKGEKRFVHEWKGAKWNFATEEQRDLFAANPEKYSPAYNGYCSNALTLDEGLIPTDGAVWQMFGDQLHLFFSERGRVRWVNGNYEELKAEADAAWKYELSKR